MANAFDWLKKTAKKLGHVDRTYYMIMYTEKGVKKNKLFRDMDAAYAFGRKKKDARIADYYPWNIGYAKVAKKMERR